jgi:YidC/Oxa1 family membrane protein insertase
MNQDPFGTQFQTSDIKRLLVAGVLIFACAVIYGQFFAVDKVAELNNTIDKKIDLKKSKTINESITNLEISLNEKNVIKNERVESLFVDANKVVNGDVSYIIGSNYEILFSSLGGKIKTINFLGYNSKIKLFNLNAAKLGFLSLESRNHDITLNTDSNYKLVFSSKNKLVWKHITDEGIEIFRTYRINYKRCILEHEIMVKNNSKNSRVVALNLYISSDIDNVLKSGFFSARASDAGVVCKIGEKRERVSFKNLSDNDKNFFGCVTYVGFDKQYFLAALMPEISDTIVNFCNLKIIKNINVGLAPTVLVSLLQEPLTLSSKESRTFKYSAFFGPKQFDILKNAGYGLEKNIDFGWFGVISRPLLWLLVKIFNITGNFGVAIIILTFLLKIITFPLTQKSFISMQKMKKFQPELKILQKKYSHDRMLLGQKQMELYKKKGVNPLAGCLPMLIQMPIWFALYQMLWNSVELYQQPFVGWLNNLTSPDPLYILPIAMGISMLIQTFFQSIPQDQPQMKYVMCGMPVFLTFIMLNMPSGLSLYIFINNVLTIFQQIYIKNRYCSK